MPINGRMNATCNATAQVHARLLGTHFEFTAPARDVPFPKLGHLRPHLLQSIHLRNTCHLGTLLTQVARRG